MITFVEIRRACSKMYRSSLRTRCLMITAPFSEAALKNGALSYSGSLDCWLATAARLSTRLVEAVFSRPLRLRNDRSCARPAN